MTESEWHQRECNVKRILAHRGSKRKREILIDRLRGRTLPGNWENPENLTEAGIVIYYLRQHKLYYATMNSVFRTFGSNKRGDCIYQALKVTLGLEITGRGWLIWKQT
jgi:hypothetical protein